MTQLQIVQIVVTIITSAKLGLNLPDACDFLGLGALLEVLLGVAAEVVGFGVPASILMLKLRTEKVTFDVAWKVSLPNCTTPR
jgi:sorbitol-specific phosphotransferase system component IIBC